MATYDFTNDLFTKFTSTPSPNVNTSYQNILMDKPIDISSIGRISPSGNIIASDNTPKFVNTGPIEEETLKPFSIQQTLGNDTTSYVVKTLMNRLGLTDYQAAGIAGVIMSESGMQTSAYNKTEKAGKLPSSSANGKGYGSGMIQWSGTRKNKALDLIGKSGSRIEDLSLDDLLEMIIKELEGDYSNTLNGIKASKNASEAAATMYCHNVGRYSKSNSPATVEEIAQVNKMYSKFASNIVNRGMNFADKIYKNLYNE